MPAEQPPHLDFAADFRVGDWMVEPSLDRLSREGTTLRLRPQLMDLLVLLAQYAGKTVSKDTILEKVWQGQHVAESGMTRCIAELRQALDDDARDPRMLQTIPKRGYRLVAPVAYVATPACLDAGPLPERLESGAAAAQPLPRRSSWRAGWAMGSVLSVTLLLAVAWGVTGWTKAPVLAERDTVLLAGFTNTTGDSAFDSTLRLALAVNLGQAPFLHILPDDHVRTALTLSGRPVSQPVVGAVALDLCRREGAAVLLAGSISRLGTHYAIGIEATACRTAESIGRELVEVERKEAVLAALEAAALRLRRRLGESRASLRQYGVPIVRATTSSLDALQAVTAGDVNRDHARGEEALQDYRRATDLDPQFALAWARRGAAAKSLGLTDEAVPAFRKAYELRHRASEPERFYILGHYFRSVADEPDTAVDTYRTWQRVYPGSAVPATNLASIFVNTFGRYEEALPDAREAVRLAPYSSVAARMLVLAYLGSNHAAEARQALQEATSRGVGDAAWHELAFQCAYLDGNEAAMREHVRWAAEHPAAEAAMTRNLALAAASAGRLNESRRLWAAASTAAARAMPPIRQAEVRLWEAETEALLGDPQRARLAADAAVALHPQPATMLDAAGSLALAGDTGRAAGLIDDANRRIEPGICSRPVWLFVSRALVDAGARRFDRATVRLADAAPFERGREYAMAPLGARALITSAAGRHSEAAVAYRQVLELRAVHPLAPWVNVARLGLARALRDSGDIAASRAAYGAILDSLRSADADAPVLTAAQRELAALRIR